jgi:heterodisulfide reductase subunit C
MPFSFSHEAVDLEFIEKMKTITGEPFKTCMQCGTCTIVCPMTANMPLTTRQVMHLTQWGQKEELLECSMDMRILPCLRGSLPTRH